MQSLSSVEDSELAYSSVNSLNTDEDDDAFDELPDDVNAITDDNEDDLICEINRNADHYRLCKAKAAHYAVLGKVDASIAKKPLTGTEAPHLHTKPLIAKLDEVVKQMILTCLRSWQNKSKIQFLEQLDHGSEKDLQLNLKLPRFNNQNDFYDIAKSWADF